MLKIRLSMHGSTHNPFFYIVVMNDRSKRNGRPIEQIGYYNPSVKKGTKRGNEERLKIDQEKLKHWISVGAQPTDTIVKLGLELGLSFLETFKKQYVKSERYGISRKKYKEALAAKAKEQKEKEKKKLEEAKAKEASKANS